MKIRALIVDDEYPARKELRYHLERYDTIQVVGEATNVHEALELINNIDYSILFLDIDMPGGSGIDLGEKVKSRPNPPFVIFVTAHDKYALSAFGVNAIDYVLKPINPRRLDDAVNKVFRLAAQKPKLVANEEKAKAEVKAEPAAAARLDLIPVDRKGKTILIEEKDIIFAFTDNDYVYVKTATEKYLTRYTLKELEARLDPNLFFRSHRCYLVNIRKTKEVIPFFNGTYTLVVDDAEKSEVPVSRTQSKKLREMLGL